jgi:hypothetical protein
MVSWYWYIWDIYNFGDNVASGLRSVAIGYLTTASGVSSFSQGQNTLMVMGHCSGWHYNANIFTCSKLPNTPEYIASGGASHAEGDSTI